MGRKLQTPTELGGESSAIQKPGTYHCSITHSADGESTRGKPTNCCSAILSVLAGTEPDQIEKEFHLHLYDPDLSKLEKEQEWPAKKQAAYAIAINQMDPSQLGNECDVDFDNAEGQQVVITLSHGQKKIEKKDGSEEWVEDTSKLKLHYANIYHVDDPRAKEFPKNKEALALLPAELRKKSEYFEALTKKNSAPAMEPKERITDEQLAGL